MTTSHENKGEGENLYAGKFKTVEELEAGYKNSLPTFQENENLKKQLEGFTKLPDEYKTPADIALHDSDLEDVKREAKNSGLTQAQYEKLARERNAKSLHKHQTYEDAKKELGADKINLLQDFIKKTYPEKTADVLIKQAIMNKEIRDSIFEQRQRALSNGAPGIGTVTSSSYAVTQKDVLKARDEMNQSRGRSRIDAQKRYIALQSQVARQKAGA